MKSTETLDFGRGDTSQGEAYGSKVEVGLFPRQDAIRRQKTQELAFRLEEKQRSKETQETCVKAEKPQTQLAQRTVRVHFLCSIQKIQSGVIHGGRECNG